MAMLRPILTLTLILDENKIQLGTFNVNETQETNEPNDEPNDEPNE